MGEGPRRRSDAEGPRGFRDSPAAADLRRHKGVVALAAGVILLLIMSVTIAGGSNEPGETETGDPVGVSSEDESATAEFESSPTQVCMAQWNQFSKEKGLLTSIDGQGRTYASIGPSADFPDECLLTVAQTTGYVIQFQGGGEGKPWGTLANDPTLAGLDPVTKQWNAAIGPDGTLAASEP